MTWLFSIVVVAYLTGVTVVAICPKYMITTSDVQHAWKASYFAYDDASNTGAQVPVINYPIIKEKTEFIQNEATGVKVFIAKKGRTSIVAFRGTIGGNQILHQVFHALQNSQ